jgi:predicted peptidase
MFRFSDNFLSALADVRFIRDIGRFHPLSIPRIEVGCMTSRFFSSSFFMAILATSAASAQTGFLKKEHTDSARYQIFVPHDYRGDKEYPIILFLHGSAESGIDGVLPVRVGIGTAIKRQEKTFPFIVVFPQSQRRNWLADSRDGKRAIAILDETCKTYKVDEKRQYLTGLSLGGYGTWSMAAKYPERWGAIAPVCGKGEPSDAPKIKDIPCWNFHGDNDVSVPVDYSRTMITALKEAGGNPKHTEYAGVGHESWDRAYATAEFYTWLLENKRK